MVQGRQINMGFKLLSDEFFTGYIRKPDGNAEITIVARGTRKDVLRPTLLAAAAKKWDWVIELRQECKDGDGVQGVLGHWSSVQGDLPPATRNEFGKGRGSMTEHHVEIMSARKYYGAHSIGKVVLVDGRPNHFTGKTAAADAKAFAKKVSMQN